MNTQATQSSEQVYGQALFDVVRNQRAVAMDAAADAGAKLAVAEARIKQLEAELAALKEKVDG